MTEPQLEMKIAPVLYPLHVNRARAVLGQRPTPVADPAVQAAVEHALSVAGVLNDGRYNDFALSVREGAVRIAIGAGASYGSAKCWPPSRFAEVANRLQSEADADVSGLR